MGSKVFIFSNHAKIKMEDRGASREEVILALQEGSFEPAKQGRILYRKNFTYDETWGEKKYKTKQVAPVVKYENDKVVIVTVYYF